MTTEDPIVAVNSDALSALQAEVSQLADLFKRRLLDDRSKNALIETVQEQVRVSNDLLRHRDLESLLSESLLAIDRLQGEPSTPELVASVVDELLEVFRRRRLVEIDDEGFFDPRLHEVVDTVTAAGDLEPHAIAAVRRKGYLLGDRLLRPSRVVIAVSRDE
ncbi:nucleotide exchange factor GrpE [Microbacterium sp. LWO12-1.2]|uniref:nucleotide exchange factor GrpE n=1 Tax=Microbacterium sp. LWO12-1.2 TaxID=3135261 RepID=UPI00344335C0